MHIGMRKALLGAGVATLAMVLSTQAFAQQRRFDIPAQDAATAVTAFGLQADVQISAPTGQLRGVKTPAVQGEMDARAALQMLLAGTGLVVARDDGRTIVLQMAPQGGSAGGGAEINAVEELIVTAQKKEEAIQDVPIAISAFTQKSLDAQKIEGGFDLLKAIPNVTFSKNNFTGYNFSIRGIGTKAISATTDPGVAVSFNNTTLIVNRLFEQEYLDVERVEVLRGPQGTLYGRNATSGVINVISAKPRLGEFAGDIKLETGNYNARRARGMINIPIGETLAVRLAGAMTKRDGYATNVMTGEDTDGRDLWTGRVTLAWEPHERLRANLLWESFEEDDERLRSAKQLCHRDPGLDPVDFGLPASTTTFTNATTQGCLPGSLYDDAAFGVPNQKALPFAVAMGPQESALAYANERQLSTNLREIEAQVDPHYIATSDVVDLSIDFDLSDSVTFTSQTLYSKDSVWSTQDLNRFASAPGSFHDSNVDHGLYEIFFPQWAAYLDLLSPNGIFCDPQLGCSDRLIGQDLSRSESEQFNQELRLASNFDGSMNFSLGANFTHFETVNDYFVFINYLTALAMGNGTAGAFEAFTSCHNPNVENPQPGILDYAFACAYIDPNPIESLNGEGHNYFRSKNPYQLNSAAVFGEFYWQATPTLKVTTGLRFTWDKKTFTPVPSQTLLLDYRQYGLPGSGPAGCTDSASLFCTLSGTAVDGRGYPEEPDIVLEWREPTGRIIVDWKPELGFTDETMVYASYAHGYKGGGMNPPSVAAPQGLFNKSGRAAVAGPTFEPEYIDAFELGTKNTLLEGSLVLNGSAFFYDYKGYQVSKIIDRSAANENFDAIVWGAELEWIYSPTRNLRFNGAFGALRTELGDDQQSMDLMDRLQGGFFPWTAADGSVYEQWLMIKPALTQTTNCLVPLELYLIALTAQPSLDSTRFCAGGNIQGVSFRGPTPQNTVPGFATGTKFFDPVTDAPNGGAGIMADVSGNELPNAPHWTASLGAQYRAELAGGWSATLRGDFYWQSQSYARVYNTQYDKLRAWTNTNVSLWFEQPDWGVTAEVYVKNAFDETPITDAFLFSDDTGLTTNIFTLDPRLVGVSVRKSF